MPSTVSASSAASIAFAPSSPPSENVGLKQPRSRRFDHIAKPFLSQYITRTRSHHREKKMNRCPLRGSWWNTSRTNTIRLSAPCARRQVAWRRTTARSAADSALGISLEQLHHPRKAVGSTDSATNKIWPERRTISIGARRDRTPMGRSSTNFGVFCGVPTLSLRVHRSTRSGLNPHAARTSQETAPRPRTPPRRRAPPRASGEVGFGGVARRRKRRATWAWRPPARSLPLARGRLHTLLVEG